ncbi:MAG: zf-HC2 domain-containing protein [Firmicutes bacterium]|nr:zf-HC2 domain-containing protein [Bacillota bacterium]
MKTSSMWERRCPGEGEWMAFYDGEGRPAEREMLGAHLRNCESCQDVFEEIGSLVMFGDEALDLVHPVSRKNQRTNRWWIPAAAAAMVILGVGASFQSAGHQALAAITSLFQVKSIGTVPVSPEELAALTRTVTRGGQVTLSHYGSVTVAGPMRQESVPLSQLPQYGMPNAWPQSLGTAKTASLQTGLRVTLRLNVPNINQLIESQGGRDLFPTSLNNQPFTLVVPAAATIQSGAWTMEEVPQPTVAVPGQVPVGQVMKALENLPFLPPTLQSAVARMANWKDTLIVPLPGNPQNVQVSGTQGIVDSSRTGHTVGAAWVNHGVVTAVMEHQNTKISQSAFTAEVKRLFP